MVTAVSGWTLRSASVLFVLLLWLCLLMCVIASGSLLGLWIDSSGGLGCCCPPPRKLCSPWSVEGLSWPRASFHLRAYPAGIAAKRASVFAWPPLSLQALSSACLFVFVLFLFLFVSSVPWDYWKMFLVFSAFCCLSHRCWQIPEINTVKNVPLTSQLSVPPGSWPRQVLSNLVICSLMSLGSWTLWRGWSDTCYPISHSVYKAGLFTFYHLLSFPLAE